MEKPGTVTTRTTSPYFSPKSAMAPAVRASAYGISRKMTGSACQIFWLTIASI
jgi:hypothetical protein